MIPQQIKYNAKLFTADKTAYLFIFILFISVNYLWAQDRSIAHTLPLFESEEILNLRIEADLKSIFSNTDDSTYFPAIISFTNDSGQSKSLDILIRTRGNTRREKDVCKFTPLRLKFSKKASKNTVFEGQKVLKLVTHCDKSDFYEQNTIIEYLIYKTFNVLTDSSFKVRPAIINYVYTDSKKDSVQKFAFFIEHEKDLASRLHGIESETLKVYPERLNTFHTCLMDMFQYMIGNTDYSAYLLHNIKMIADSSGRMPSIVIPYDFDWSGLVAANYAVPNPSLKTINVKERVYRGFKKEPEIVYHTIARFKNKKDEIYRLFENFELLKKSEKKQIINYLNEFYRIINNDRKVKIEFIDKARILHD